MSRTWRSLAALALSGGLVLAACGDDDEEPVTVPATEPMTDTTAMTDDSMTEDTMTDDSMTDDSMTDDTEMMEETSTSTP
jgi:hypothetical protein